MDKYYYKVEEGICVENCYKLPHIPQGTPIGALFCFCCGFRVNSGEDKKGVYIICEKWQKSNNNNGCCSSNNNLQRYTE